jgi:TolB-like protein
VLPFKDLTGSQSGADAIDYDKIGVGIADNFATDLSTFPELQVVSTASAAAYADKSIPEIAEATGASFVIQGSIRHVSNQASATVELIDARKDTYSIGVRVTAPVADPVPLQSQMAATIRDQLAGMTGVF